ncbi:MAG TPA: translocation/assembly module TamB domain-containing protein, partial [Burkholderiales bacterium]|nr:translocation/assembly module TamB domain-containing protein [Burkholderiales bacterium]
MKPAGRSRPARVALMALLLLAAFLAGLAAWGRSEPALRWAAAQAAAWSGGALTLEGVSGSVLGPLRVQRLRWRSLDAEVNVQDFEADWSPARLILARTLHLDRLTAARVEVAVQPGDAPFVLPQDLAPPLPVTLNGVSLPRIEVRGLAPGTLALGIAGNLRADTREYRLDLAGLQIPGARLSGRATLASATPFALGGELTAEADFAGQSFRIPLRLSGVLEAVEIAATVEHPWARGAASATLAPFAGQALRRLRAELSGMDPARHGDALPRADLVARLTAAAAERGLAGKIEIENRAPGRIDQGKLPLERARSQLAYDGGTLRLDALVIALAGAGTLQGSGHADAQGAEFALRTEGVALNALHASLRPLRPAGTLLITANATEQAALARLSAGEYRLQLDALHRDAVVSVRGLTLQARGSELEAAAELRLDAGRSFSARGKLKSFNPAQWGDFPRARLNARLEAEGKLSPQPQGTLRYRILDSQYRAAPLSGEGTIAYAGKQSLTADGHLALGDNRLGFRGSLGPGERLAWNLDAGNLSAFGPEFSGRGTAAGWFSGTPEQPSFGFELEADRLRLPEGIAAGGLQAAGEYAPGDQGVLRGRLSARKARLGAYDLDALSASADGTPSRHDLDVSVKSAVLDIQAAAEGGIAPGPRWSGRLLRVVTARPYAGSLAAPTTLTVGSGELEIGAAEFGVGDARLALERFAWRDGQLATRGRFSALPLALLLKPAPEAAWRSDLSFSGSWDLEAGTELNGELHIARDGGDIRLGTGKPLQLGLSRVSLEASARGSRVEAVVLAEGERLGQLRAAGSTRLERGAAGWHLPAEGPLSGEIQGRVPDLAWLGPLLDPILATAGALEINATIAGSPGNPVIRGQVAGRDLEAHVDPTGLHLTGGTLAAEFSGERLVVRELTLRGGAGSLKTSGSVSFAGGRREGALDFALDRLSIVDMPGQKLQVSGSGKLALEGARLALTGAIRADQGLIELQEWDRPSLSEDVVIVGRERAAHGGGAAPGLRL